MLISGANTPTGAERRQPDSGLDSPDRDVPTGHDVPEVFSDVLETIAVSDELNAERGFVDASADRPNANGEPGNDDEAPSDGDSEIQRHRDEREMPPHNGKTTEAPLHATEKSSIEPPDHGAANRPVTIRVSEAAGGRGLPDHTTPLVGGRFAGPSDYQPGDPMIDEPAPRPSRSLASPGLEKGRPERKTLADLPREFLSPSGGMVPPIQSAPAPPDDVSLNQMAAAVPPPNTGFEGPTAPVPKMQATDPLPPFSELAATLFDPSEKSDGNRQGAFQEKPTGQPMIAPQSAEAISTPAVPRGQSLENALPGAPDQGQTFYTDMPGAGREHVGMKRDTRNLQSTRHQMPKVTLSLSRVVDNEQHGIPKLYPHDRMIAGATDANRPVSGAETPMNKTAFRFDALPRPIRAMPPPQRSPAELSVEPVDAPKTAELRSGLTVPQGAPPESALAGVPDRKETPDTDLLRVNWKPADKISEYRNLRPMGRQIPKAAPGESRAIDQARPSNPKPNAPTEKSLPAQQVGRVIHQVDARIFQPSELGPVRNAARAGDPAPVDERDGKTRMTPSASPTIYQPQVRWRHVTTKGAILTPVRPSNQAQTPSDVAVNLPISAGVKSQVVETPNFPQPTVNDATSTTVTTHSQPTADHTAPSVAIHQPVSQLAPLTIALAAPGVNHGGSAVFAAQIADVLAQNRDRKIEISLHPKELGHVRMSMAISDSGVTVTIAADRPETLDLMRRHIDNLFGALQSLGHHNVSFNFSGTGNRQPQTWETAQSERQLPADSAPEPTPGKPAQTNQTRDLDLRL